MTTHTETRALIARVRDDIAPADQPQALRDLARSADGEPRVDAGMLRREADEIEDARRRGVPPSLVDVWLAFDADDRVGSIVEDPSLCDFIAGEIESYRDLADEHEQEIEQLRARVAELEAVPGKVTAAHALAMAEARGRREGAAAMRELAAKHLAERGSAIVAQSEEFRAKGKTKVADRLLAEARAVVAASGAVRALPLDDDAREDAQGQEVNER